MDSFIQRLMATRPSRQEYIHLQGSGGPGSDSDVTVFDGPFPSPLGGPSGRPTPFFVSHCEGVSLDLTKGKAAQLTVERCRNVAIRSGKVIGSTELIWTTDSLVSIVLPQETEEGPVSGTLTVDNCKAVVVALPLRLAKGVQIYTTNSDGIRIQIYDETLSPALGPSSSMASSVRPVEVNAAPMEVEGSTASLNSALSADATTSAGEVPGEVISEYIVPGEEADVNGATPERTSSSHNNGSSTVRRNIRKRTTFDSSSNTWSTVHSNLYGDEVAILDNGTAAPVHQRSRSTSPERGTSSANPTSNTEPVHSPAR